MTSVTVVVPVHNGRECIGETLHALLAQSFDDFSILVVDDGSSDESHLVVEGIHDPRLRLIRQPNLGLCAAVNRGVSEATTEFVARNDQDDVSLPHRLEREVEFLRRNPDVGCVFSHYSKFGRKRRWANRDKQTHNVGQARRFDPERDGCQLASTLCARASLLQGVPFRQAYYPADDWDFELRLSQLADLRILAEALVDYRFHTSSNTYRHFFEMQDKARWAEDSARRRRRGDSELSFQAFLGDRRESQRERTERLRLETSRLHMRLAGQRFLDGQDAAALWHAAASALLDPRDLWHRLQRLALSA